MQHPGLKVVIKLALFCVLIAASIAALTWLVIPNNPDAYQAATPDKLALAERTPSPKVLLVGGSNLAFSVDSELIEAALGRPVVNMGLAKAVGFRYLLEEVKPFVGPGDIVVVAPAYELYFDLFDGSESLVIMLQHNPGRIRDISSFAEVRTILRYFTLMMQMKVSGFIRKGIVDDPVYRRSGFNSHGDLVTHLDLEEQYEPRELFPENKPFDERSIEVLNDFASEVEASGGLAVISYPSLHDKILEKHREKIEMLDRRLREDLSMAVISDPDDYAFPREELFDTPYHLRRAGREKRSRQLAGDILSFFGLESGLEGGSGGEEE
jgi:hypothetical protein